MVHKLASNRSIFSVNVVHNSDHISTEGGHAEHALVRRVKEG